jgi:hypothetical protein
MTHLYSAPSGMYLLVKQRSLFAVRPTAAQRMLVTAHNDDGRDADGRTAPARTPTSPRPSSLQSQHGEWHPWMAGPDRAAAADADADADADDHDAHRKVDKGGEETPLAALLRAHSLGEYAPVFARHQIDVDAFLLLREPHLEALGVTPLGPRLKLSALIARLRDRTLARSTDDDDGDDDDRNHNHANDDDAAAFGEAEVVSPSRELGTALPPLRAAPNGTAVMALAKSATPALGRTARAAGVVVPEAPAISADELELGECIGRGSFSDVFRCVALAHKVARPMWLTQARANDTAATGRTARWRSSG